MKRKINAVVYEVDIDGEAKRIHAVNMKPGVRAGQVPRHTHTLFGDEADDG